jgi:hypothetical protein
MVLVTSRPNISSKQMGQLEGAEESIIELYHFYQNINNEFVEIKININFLFFSYFFLDLKIY